MQITLPRLLGFVLATWVAAPLILYSILPDWQTRGQFGDLYGSVNALFSGFAFAGLYWALNLQREQLKLQQEQLVLQREELGLQRQEMKASRTELANQVEAQRSLFRASVAQVVVAKAQAQIEAINMESSKMPPHARKAYSHRIEIIANSLGELADRLENPPSSV